MCFFNLTFYSTGCYFFQEFCFMGRFKESVNLASVIIGFIYCFLSSSSFLLFPLSSSSFYFFVFLFKVKTQCARET